MDQKLSVQELADLKLNLIVGSYRLPRLFRISNTQSLYGYLGQKGSSPENSLSYEKTSSSPAALQMQREIWFQRRRHHHLHRSWNLLFLYELNWKYIL